MHWPCFESYQRNVSPWFASPFASFGIDQQNMIIPRTTFPSTLSEISQETSQRWVFSDWEKNPLSIGLPVACLAPTRQPRAPAERPRPRIAGGADPCPRRRIQQCRRHHFGPGHLAHRLFGSILCRPCGQYGDCYHDLGIIDPPRFVCVSFKPA